MVLFELQSSLLNKLVARDDGCTCARCRCSIDHYAGSSHQVSFVILRTQALFPGSTAHVIELCTTQATAESVRSQKDDLSDSRHVVASNAQLYQSFTLLALLIPFCCSKGHQRGVSRILGAVALMCCAFTHNTGQRTAGTHGFLTTNVVGRDKNSTGSVMAVGSIRSAEFKSLLDKVLHLGRREQRSGDFKRDGLTAAARREQ